MEPITQIITALTVAASAAGKALVSETVKDAYIKLKKALVTRLGGKSDVEVSLALLEKEPESMTRQQRLQAELEKGRAGEDHDIVELAQRLSNLLQKEGFLKGPTSQAKLKGSGAIAIGPGAVAAGEGGIAVGGNVSGGITITDHKGKDR